MKIEFSFLQVLLQWNARYLSVRYQMQLSYILAFEETRLSKYRNRIVKGSVI